MPDERASWEQASAGCALRCLRGGTGGAARADPRRRAAPAGGARAADRRGGPDPRGAGRAAAGSNRPPCRARSPARPRPCPDGRERDPRVGPPEPPPHRHRHLSRARPRHPEGDRRGAGGPGLLHQSRARAQPLASWAPVALRGVAHGGPLRADRPASRAGLPGGAGLPDRCAIPACSWPTPWRRSSTASDADLISGMLTAIRDFVADSFAREREVGGLRRFSVGELTVMVEQGPQALIAAVVRGEAPDSLLTRNSRTRWRRSISSSRVRSPTSTATRRGSPPARPLLEECLATVARDRPRARGAPARGVASLGACRTSPGGRSWRARAAGAPALGPRGRAAPVGARHRADPGRAQRRPLALRRAARPARARSRGAARRPGGGHRAESSSAGNRISRSAPNWCWPEPGGTCRRRPACSWRSPGTRSGRRAPLRSTGWCRRERTRRQRPRRVGSRPERGRGRNAGGAGPAAAGDRGRAGVVRRRLSRARRDRPERRDQGGRNDSAVSRPARPRWGPAPRSSWSVAPTRPGPTLLTRR